MNNKFIIAILGAVLLFTLGSASPNLFLNEPPLLIRKIEINITGLSTVGKYNCATTLFRKDSLTWQLPSKNTLKAEIPMVKIDCGNKIMTKDLQATVKSTQYPSSNVTLANITPIGNNQYKCQLAFIITNKTIRYKDFLLTKNNQQLKGRIALKFSDIGLQPPVKMGGLIKVKDEIEIYFSLFRN